MRRQCIAAALALVIGGCKPTAPAIPESERQMQATADAAGREARAREAAALVAVTRAEAVESQAMTEVRAADVAVQAGDPLPIEEVERRRVVQMEATQQREAAAQAHARAREAVDAADREKATYEQRREQRLKGWRAEMTRSGTRIVVGGGVLILGGFVAGALGVDELVGRSSLADRAPGESEEEHRAAIERSNRELTAEFVIAAPLLAVGIAMAVIGGRRVKETRVTVGKGGVAIRF